MKRLTMNHVARANIRVNRKAYISLFLGILLAVYLATATSLCAWGAVRGHEEEMAERVGWGDMFLLDGERVTDEQLRSCGFFREIGHVTVNATVEDSNICAGYYDETADRLMNRTLKDGRLPEKAGEMAAEKSALIRLGLEESGVGDRLTLTMKPVHGVSEVRTFTLVGILNEQTDYLDTYYEEEGMRFPALLVSPEEKYDVGSAMVHRVLTYAPTITYNQVTRNCPLELISPYGISREDGSVTFYDSGWDRAKRIWERAIVWIVLGAATLLSVCVGITSAMESLLSRKTEDIGMLRAIGATRRQIRRIYGAEAWLLTLTALPAGLILGVLTAWIVSRIASDSVAFLPNAWLLIPILGLSALCVFVASRMPLVHASRQMPMGVLRDTKLMRRAGKLRNHRIFRPDSLIAGRRIRLHPLRLLGAAGMITLTLLSALMLGELAMGLNTEKGGNTPDYQIQGGAYASDDSFAQIIEEDAMSRSDLERIAAVPGVERVGSVTEIQANLLMDTIPEYFRTRNEYSTYDDGSTSEIVIGTLEGAWGGSEWLFLDDEEIADARARRDEDYTAYYNMKCIDRMNGIRSELGITESIVPVKVLVADLDPETLKEFVTDGRINMEQLDRGEQALVFAPTVCARKESSGGYVIDKWLPAGEIRDEEWDIIIRNDAFTAGTPLKLLELAGKMEIAEDESGFPEYRVNTTDHVRAEVTVGAVLSGPVRISEYYQSGFTVILSPKGAEALGLKLPSPTYTGIWLEGNPSPEAEKEIESEISQITMGSWMNLENRRELNREYRLKKMRQMLLFAGLILLFFAVSLFMQVSGAARQIRSETRMIGTLRAVGADLKTLVGCYRLPVWGSAIAALIPCVLFYLITTIPGLRLFSKNHPVVILPVLAAMAACVALASVAGIHKRLAGVTRRSIVENIREL